jgi:AbrB family looped-hinge helix DNA binding protein
MYLHPYFPLSLLGRDISLSYFQKVGCRDMGKQLGAAKILPKGQVTIPVEARRVMKLDVGDYVVFEEEDGRLVLSKAVLRKS